MKSFRLILPYLFTAFVFTLSAHDASAQSATYTALAPLPGLTTVNTTDPEALAAYVNAIYKAAIVVAGVLAVVMITLGGIEYMASDSPFSKGDGKTKITNALIGLLLLVSCFIILNTINPKLLDVDITIPAASGSASGGTGATPVTGASTGSGAVNTTSGNNPTGNTLPAANSAGGDSPLFTPTNDGGSQTT